MGNLMPPKGKFGLQISHLCGSSYNHVLSAVSQKIYLVHFVLSMCLFHFQPTAR